MFDGAVHSVCPDSTFHWLLYPEPAVKYSLKQTVWLVRSFLHNQKERAAQHLVFPDWISFLPVNWLFFPW